MRNNRLNILVKELNTRIAKEYTDFKGCYLYGSRVKKTHHKDSDVDIVAIFDYIDRAKEFEIRGIVCELMYIYDVYIDFRTFTFDGLISNPIYCDEVVKKGKFYEAA
jgi:predicted nucleotidyltransferase